VAVKRSWQSGGGTAAASPGRGTPRRRACQRLFASTTASPAHLLPLTLPRLGVRKACQGQRRLLHSQGSCVRSDGLHQQLKSTYVCLCACACVCVYICVCLCVDLCVYLGVSVCLIYASVCVIYYLGIYVSVCVCICMYISACVCLCMSVYLCVWGCACVYVCVSGCIRVCIWVCLGASVCIWVHLCVSVYLGASVRVWVCLCIWVCLGVSGSVRLPMFCALLKILPLGAPPARFRRLSNDPHKPSPELLSAASPLRNVKGRTHKV